MIRVLLALLIFHSLLAPTHAQISPIRLEVKQNVKTESKGKTRDTKTQVRSLTMTVANIGKERIDDIEMHYWFFARDMKSRSVSILSNGIRKASLAPGARETSESESVTSTYTDDHFLVEGGASGSRNNPRVKKVEASGKKITGYAVVVKSGGRVVAEVYSEPSFKERVAGR